MNTRAVTPGFLPLLALLFIGLKLCGVISWSWVWVLCPLWAPFAFLFALIITGFIVAVIVAAFSLSK